MQIIVPCRHALILAAIKMHKRKLFIMALAEFVSCLRLGVMSMQPLCESLKPKENGVYTMKLCSMCVSNDNSALKNLFSQGFSIGEDGSNHHRVVSHS